MVRDPSRWSRDNVANETGLDTLRDHGIRFFVLGMEFSLYDPIHRHFLASQASTNKLQAALTKQTSINSRRTRARLTGAPTCGKRPWGRIWDGTKWAIDPDKQTMIRDVAKRYLKGERMPELAKEYGVNHSNLHKVVMQRCGPVWRQTFRAADLNIHEVIETQVPPLLDDATIKALRRRAKRNKTRHQNNTENRYLLAGYIFCDHCGYALCPQPNPNGRLYYRHNPRDGAAKCTATPRAWVRCADIEAAVLRDILHFYGNPKAIAKAMEDAVPNLERLKAIHAEVAAIDKRVANVATEVGRLVDKIAEDVISAADARGKRQALAAREVDLQAKRAALLRQCENLPTPAAIGEAAEELATRQSLAKWMVSHDLVDPDVLTWEQKRELIEEVFQGTLPDGRPAGVYIVAPVGGPPNHRYKTWRFQLRGSAEINGVFGRSKATRKSAQH
jgi:hypothetical protein